MSSPTQNLFAAGLDLVTNGMRAFCYHFVSTDWDQEKSTEQMSQALKINRRDDNLIRPIRGAHPSQDDEGMSEFGKTSAKNPGPSSIITLKDEKDEGVNVEEIATKLNGDTLVNSSEVEEKAARLSHKEGMQSTPLETKGLWQEKPTAPCQSVGKADTLNVNDLLVGKVAATEDKVKSGALPGLDLSRPKRNVKQKAKTLSDDGSKGAGKQGKLGREEIIPSGKKKNGATCYAFLILDLFSGKKLNVAACLILLFGGAHAFTGPTNQVVLRGQEGILTCFTDTGYPVKWLKEQIIIFSGYDFLSDVRSSYEIANGYEGQYNLTIKDANENIAGFYTCQQSGDFKRVTAGFIVLDLNCSTMEGNDTRVVCTVVVSGSNETSILWEIIQKDGTTNATKMFTISSNSSDTVHGIPRQNITTELIISGNDRHTIDLCRLTMAFNVTGRTDITLEPEEKMADNTPIYTVNISCSNSVPTDESNSASNSADTGLWKILTGISVPSAIVLLVVIAVVVFKYRYCPRRKSANKDNRLERNGAGEPLQSTTM